MKKSRFTDSQIIATLKRAETGTPVSELCREQGISTATFYADSTDNGPLRSHPIRPARS